MNEAEEDEIYDDVQPGGPPPPSLPSRPAKLPPIPSVTTRPPSTPMNTVEPLIVDTSL